MSNARSSTAARAAEGDGRVPEPPCDAVLLRVELRRGARCRSGWFGRRASCSSRMVRASSKSPRDAKNSASSSADSSSGGPGLSAKGGRGDGCSTRLAPRPPAATQVERRRRSRARLEREARQRPSPNGSSMPSSRAGLAPRPPGAAPGADARLRVRAREPRPRGRSLRGRTTEAAPRRDRGLTVVGARLVVCESPRDGSASSALRRARSRARAASWSRVAFSGSSDERVLQRARGRLRRRARRCAARRCASICGDGLLVFGPPRAGRRGASGAARSTCGAISSADAQRLDGLRVASRDSRKRRRVGQDARDLRVDDAGRGRRLVDLFDDLDVAARRRATLAVGASAGGAALRAQLEVGCSSALDVALADVFVRRGAARVRRDAAAASAATAARAGGAMEGGIVDPVGQRAARPRRSARASGAWRELAGRAPSCRCRARCRAISFWTSMALRRLPDLR